MCRSPDKAAQAKHGQGDPLPSAGRRGITGQRAGTVTDAHGASCVVWPRPLRRSPPEQAKATGKWRDNIRRGGSRARQSEQRETGGISPAASRHHERPEAAIQGPFVQTYSWRWPGLLRSREQSRQEPLGSCADSWLCTIISNPSAHDGCNRLGERTALADGF